MGQKVRIALVGFMSGAAIPFLFLMALDASLLVLELWGLWLGTAQFSAPQGQTATGAFLLTLSHSLAALLKHFWSCRYVGIAMGAVGMTTAVVGYHAARAGRGTKRATFLTVLAVSTFVTNAAAMLMQERRSALAAAERLVFIYYRVGRSYWAVLIVGTAGAFLLAVVVWELWRVVYGQLAHGLRISLPIPRASPGSWRPALTQRLREDRQAYQDRIHRLKLAAARPHLSLPEQPGATAERSGQRRWWPLVLFLLVCMALWIPLQEAYLHLAPSVTSEVVYLKPDQPMDSVRITVGSEARAITFSSSTGQGIVDLHLEDRRGRVLDEIKGFRLMDLPGIAYNTTIMSIEDLPSGEYTLRLTLRPMMEEPATESVIGKSGGLISWSLLQGGGPWFRILAVLMSGLATVLFISACLLIVRLGHWLRDRYL